jgi:hypothetical protein
LKPVAIGRMRIPFAQLPHQVAVSSSDGEMAVVSDEGYVARMAVPAAVLQALSGSTTSAT